MGKSVNSCFKIISCAGSDDAVDRDEIENKGSDKRGWSFRKRSARHRVLSNTVVTEPPALDNKEISEPITVSSEPQINSSINEKTSDSIWTEAIPDSFTKNATVSTIVTESFVEDDKKCEPVRDESKLVSRSEIESESAVLVIQASVRRFLAQRQLEKHKNVVKLQAAVRGHLVRTHAVGTLRCVQAIVKMQALVRARNAERSSIGEKRVQNPTYVSVEKLLSNRLARQLLDSTPKTKQINIKCDPSKSDSAWNWLERWMSVSSPETTETLAPEQDQDKVIKTEKEVEYIVPSNVEEETVPSEEKENSINIDYISHVKKHEEEKPVPELIEKSDSPPEEPMDLITETPIEVIPVPENPVSETKPNQVSENPVSEMEQKRTTKRLATDQPDSEGRKSVFGSRKASNPAFIAAQSRFEELTSKTNPLKSPTFSNKDNESDSSAVICSFDPLKPVSSSNQEDEADSGSVSGSHVDIVSSDLLKRDGEVSSTDFDSSAPEKLTAVTHIEPDEYLVSKSSRVIQNGGSECGTELSITSTLDSPDHFVENKKLEKEVEAFDEAVGDMNSNNNIVITIPKSHDTIVDDAETEKLEPANNFEQKLDYSASDADIELEPVSGHHVYKSNAPEHETGPQVSGEASPRSHMTVPESHGTPSSQISTNSKKSKTDKKVSSQKRKSWSTSKKSPVRSSADSSLRSSLEQLPKDTKPQKRRNSFGSPRPDNIDHEPRDGNNNTSVPSYMQATESAKLKAVANSSPKSSPDLQDKEGYLKKRHSLPGAVNGRQGSPRIQRSMSQALPTTKGNGSQERKWQR